MIPNLSMFAVLPFIAPGLAAAGAGLASVPIIIHLLNRRRFRRIIWAAMDWLLAAQRKNARRIRIEQLILLIIRCLIMLLIGLALAQPILQAMNLGVLGQTRLTRVIILDDSYSMNYGGLKTAGQSAITDIGAPFDKAKAVAKELINLSAEGRDSIYVVLAGSPARPMFSAPGTVRKTILDAIDQLRPTCRSTDLGGAMESARKVLASDPAENKQVVLVTDRSKSAWMAQSVGPGGGPTFKIGSVANKLRDLASLHVVDVGPDDPPHVALTGLTATHRVIQFDHQVFVAATVYNFSPSARKDIFLKLERDPLRETTTPEKGEIIPVPEVAPDKSVTVERLVPFVEAGFHTVRATLVNADGSDLANDKLVEDHERFLSLRLQRRINVRLVDGKPAGPGRNEAESEVFWVSKALTPVVGATELQREEELNKYKLYPASDTSLRPSGAWLDHQDLLILANVDLSAVAEQKDLAREVSEFVARGGGLMIFMGSQTESASNIRAYNDLFYANGKGPLPARLVDAVNSTDKVRGEEITGDLNHPVLEQFKAKPTMIPYNRVFRHIKAELPANSPATVLLKGVESGDPIIVLSKFGQGRVALVTTSANSDWNNFGAHKTLVPLLQVLSFYLAPPMEMFRTVDVGSPVAELLTAEQAANPGEMQLALPGVMAPPHAAPMAIRPEARFAEGDPAAAADRRQYVARSADLDQPGLYVLKTAEVRPQADADGKPLPVDRVEQLSRFVYAVNPPALDEGNLRTVDVKTVSEMLGGNIKVLTEKDVKEAATDTPGGGRLSQTLLYLVLALCLLEMVLAQRFGHFHD